MSQANWICPTCQQVLTHCSGQWRCESGHSFDVAKQGYVNLLLAQHKSSKDPGDNKAMVNARRYFLSQGHYQPLAEKIAALLLDELLLEQLNAKPVNVFDAGCGEGYYLNTLQQAFAKDGRQVNAQGIDISKFALQKAAKSYAQVSFAVASSFKLPLPAISQNAVIQVFAPADAGQIRRVLAIGGLWLKIDPAQQHLAQLKAMLYQQAQAHSVHQEIPEGFELVSQQSMDFPLILSSAETRLALLQMTPFYWSATAESIARIGAELLQENAHFDLKLWRKVSD